MRFTCVRILSGCVSRKSFIATGSQSKRRKMQRQDNTWLSRGRRREEVEAMRKRKPWVRWNCEGDRPSTEAHCYRREIQRQRRADWHYQTSARENTSTEGAARNLVTKLLLGTLKHKSASWARGGPRPCEIPGLRWVLPSNRDGGSVPWHQKSRPVSQQTEHSSLTSMLSSFNTSCTRMFLCAGWSPLPCPPLCT